MEKDLRWHDELSGRQLRHISIATPAGIRVHVQPVSFLHHEPCQQSASHCLKQHRNLARSAIAHCDVNMHIQAAAAPPLQISSRCRVHT